MAPLGAVSGGWRRSGRRGKNGAMTGCTGALLAGVLGVSLLAELANASELGHDAGTRGRGAVAFVSEPAAGFTDWNGPTAGGLAASGRPAEIEAPLPSHLRNGGRGDRPLSPLAVAMGGCVSVAALLLAAANACAQRGGSAQRGTQRRPQQATPRLRRTSSLESDEASPGMSPSMPGPVTHSPLAVAAASRRVSTFQSRTQVSADAVSSSPRRTRSSSARAPLRAGNAAEALPLAALPPPPPDIEGGAGSAR